MTADSFLDGRVTLHKGDCRDVLAAMPDASVDSVVCDPPYGLEFMGKEWDSFTGAGMTKPGIGERATAWPSFTGTNRTRCRACGHLVGQGGSACKCEKPDPYNAAMPRLLGFQSFMYDVFSLALRVLKPGGHLVAFGGTRTYHRLAVAIEDAGFEIRDQVAWVYGSGFPKSRNIGDGWGTALKPAWEPIALARKPLIGTVAANVLAHGTGAINVDACRIPTGDNLGGGAEIATTASQKGNEGWVRPWMKDDEARNEHAARVRSNVVKAETLGRFPANLIHDGSDEVLACFPDSKGQQGDVRGTEPSRTGMDGTNCYGEYGRIPAAARNDSGSAARFFYSSKADADDRLGSKHPTIKPVDLMQWLVRLVTPRGGTCLDPFAGTGTTGEAAWREGMNAILIEREPEYQADVARRMDLADKPRKRAAVARTKNNIREIGPLFTNIEAAE